MLTECGKGKGSKIGMIVSKDKRKSYESPTFRCLGQSCCKLCSASDSAGGRVPADWKDIYIFHRWIDFATLPSESADTCLSQNDINIHTLLSEVYSIHI